MAAVLAIDLGGTKLAAARVIAGRIVERRETPTVRIGGPAAWIAAIGDLVSGWDGLSAAGIAVTGVVHGGRWRALNTDTLPLDGDFPLEAALGARLGLPLVARNDAQAAAWGEFRHGGGRARTIAFVTVSTGIGGGLVADGTLLAGRGGLAGHLGITPIDTPDGVRLLEDVASGGALDRLAADRGGARAVTAAALAGAGWAEALMQRVTAPLALALRRLQLVFDPELMVVGGGLGLAPGYLDRLRRHLADVPAPLRPNIVAAALGADAGLIGIADLARSHAAPEGTP